MLTDAQRQEAVASLLKSHATKVQGERPSVMFPDFEIEDSYAISALVAEELQKQGQKIIGHKVGLTSKAMRASSGIDEPDYGYMFDDMLLEDGAIVQHSNFCVPRGEPELTFVLKDGLKGPNVTLVDVLNATDYIIPSIEIIDARVTEPRKIYDTLADNGAGAGIVLGGRPVRPDDVDLCRIGAAFYRNSEIEETGLAVGVLGHPGKAIAWLANKISDYGHAMEPGHLVLSGSFTRPVWANKGDTLLADFGELGSVAVKFD
jgi:2-oxo-hept-3-ene-1,7-dioate hydratase